jgi:aspartyl-tRNA(Asn)/glutamyl-tRNA(Gln) amidotransferase subunit C
MKQQNKLTKEQVGHVAQLANLPLDEVKVKKFSIQLTEVLEYMSKIQTLDTTSVKETSQVTGLVDVFREDKIEIDRMFTQEEALANAKEKHNGYFVVKSVFEE